MEQNLTKAAQLIKKAIEQLKKAAKQFEKVGLKLDFEIKIKVLPPFSKI